MGRTAMELTQVSYFINLAETLNFTAAARMSGVSQPSLTRAIRRLEEELGGPLIHRDGKNSRLTGLGQDVEAEFRRMMAAMKSVRDHSETWAMGRHRVLDVAVVGHRVRDPFQGVVELLGLGRGDHGWVSGVAGGVGGVGEGGEIPRLERCVA